MREYQIDLMADLDHMTWRRFCVLLGGLSGDSRVVSSIVYKQNEPLTGEEAERAFAQWG